MQEEVKKHLQFVNLWVSILRSLNLLFTGEIRNFCLIAFFLHFFSFLQKKTKTMLSQAFFKFGIGLVILHHVSSLFTSNILKPPVEQHHSLTPLFEKNAEESLLSRSSSRRHWCGELSTAALAVAVALGPNPSKASAFCGERYPEWAYSLSFNEGLISYEEGGAQLFVRLVGDEKKELSSKVSPVLLIPGGPGLSHNYLETMEAIAKTDRRVLTFDPLGCGDSAKVEQRGAGVPATTVMASASPSALASQATAVMKGVGLLPSRDGKTVGVAHHVWGHGTGAAAALIYAASREPGEVLSITLASPIFGPPPTISAPSFAQGNEDVKSGSSSGISGGERAPYAWTSSDDPVVKGSITFRSRPVCLADAIDPPGRSSQLIYESWKPARSEELFEIASKIAAKAPPSGIPTFLTTGGRDLEAATASLPMATRLLASISARRGADESSQRKVEGAKTSAPAIIAAYGESGHLPHLDEREKYIQDMFKFLALAEKKGT